MLRPAPSTPVLIGPDSPISPEVLENSHPRSPDFTVRTTGGPTHINLMWDSVLAAADHIRAASSSFTQIRYLLYQVGGTLGPTAGHLHWRVPEFHAHFTALLAGTAGTEELLTQASNGADTAHQAYRDVETTVQSWLAMLRLIGEHELVIEHLLSPNGDKSYAYDWLITTGVVSGGAAVDLIALRFPVVSTVIGTLAAMEKQAGLTPSLMGRNEQVLNPDPVDQFSHTAEGTVNHYLDHMAEVSDHGDIAVSRIDKDDGATAYAVYLPGVDIDGLKAGHGRSPMSLVDGLGNDSQHMVSMVEEALEAAGASEGSTVVPIGYSMGGLHVLNMVNNKSLNQKYTIPSATTIGSPGQNKRIETEVKLTHFEDRRDPVPHLLAERHQESTQRLSVVYDFHNPDSHIESVLGSAHTLEHNTEAISTVEQAPGEWLSDEEVEHLDSLRGHLDGQATTTVFSTRWRQQQDPDHLYPWEAESMEDLEYLQQAIEDGLGEARDLGKQLPGRQQPTSTPATVDWDAAEATTGTMLRAE